VQRHGACAGGGVGGGAGVQRQRVETYIVLRSCLRQQQPAALTAAPGTRRESAMKVTDILRVKGNTLFTVTPDQPLAQAASMMAELDIGSLVVMEHGDLVGMLTFREVIQAVVANGGAIGTRLVRSVMDDAPLTCTPATEIDEVRRMMLLRHARYMPVLDKRTLMGVISFYDVAKTVVDAQDFENRMLKAYIRDWPEEGGAAAAAPG
jgi:CBS domain-containing protein